MSFDIPQSHSSDDEPHKDEVNSLKTPSDSSFANGTGISLQQMRLAQVLSRENIGWILILALAGEVFGITDRALILLGGVC